MFVFYFTINVDVCVITLQVQTTQWVSKYFEKLIYKVSDPCFYKRLLPTFTVCIRILDCSLYKVKSSTTFKIFT